MFEIEEVEFNEGLYKKNIEENEFSDEDSDGKGSDPE